jgi:hypothetical protein
VIGQDKILSVKKSATHRQMLRTFAKDITAKADYAPIFENRRENLLSLVSETPP